jgi:hypothetical protein
VPAGLSVFRIGDDGKLIDVGQLRQDIAARALSRNHNTRRCAYLDAGAPLKGKGERIRTVGSAMRLRGSGVTSPYPGGEWRLLGSPPDNSIGVPRPATARMTGAPVDRPHSDEPRNRCLLSAELNVRIHSSPAESYANHWFLPALFAGSPPPDRIG